MSEERRPLWPWIAAMLVGLPVLYVASFGPACWMLSNDLVSYDHVNRVYRPLVQLAVHGPEGVQKPIRSYVRFWNGEEALVIGYILDALTVKNEPNVSLRLTERIFPGGGARR